ncbi:glycosyltransferase family 4 protein [Chitinophaga varians]|uniref:glycosyltransferase family 4 protein n=1 Tax=Chitinophaga varians TaxID=2202339 RepID=UPI00165F72B1|nr:glycosyltransferase family 4 protein [Chitinophaga varians]MBC9908890.1 glycosyltransferase family 4 protein [Chitinophaga varians]
MRILYIHQYFAMPASSGGTRSYDLATRFAKAGHQVQVITTSSFLKQYTFTDTWTVMEVDGIELHVLNLEYSNKMSFAKRALTFVKFVAKSTMRVLKLKGDVVLATSTPITIAVPAMIKRSLHRVPFIFEVRDVWPEVPVAMGIINNKLLVGLLNRFEKRIYKRAAHIVPLSDDMKRSIEERTAVPVKKMSVIPNISEVVRFGKYDSGKSILNGLLGFTPEKVVLYAGTLGMVNGLRYLVDLSVHMLRLDDSVKFIVFGDGMEKAALTEYAEEKGVLGINLFFFDPVPKSQLSQLYYECTIASSFVIPVPELWANSANKFFDCLAAGRPILINHRGWQANVIEQENVGFVMHYDTADMPVEARRFAEYINDKTLLQRQQAKAKLLAQQRYSLDIAAGAYLKILDHVVS